MDDQTLAARAVAAAGWRWMPGVRWVAHRAPPLEPVTGRITDLPRTMYHRWTPYPGAVPDLDDPATLGCLLAMVRETLESRHGAYCAACAVHTHTGWGVGVRFGSESSLAIVAPACATEAEALVVALARAP